MQARSPVGCGALDPCVSGANHFLIMGIIEFLLSDEDVPETCADIAHRLGLVLKEEVA